MVIFLISSLTEYYSGDGYGARPVYETNGMARRLGRYWKKDSRILLLQYYARQTFDGMDLIEDILMPRSIGRRIYLITDGSYFFINEGRTYFFGEGTVLEDQRKYRLYSGEVYTGGKGTTNMDLRLPEASGFDAIFHIGRNGSIRFVYYDDKLRRKGISDLTVRTYDELIKLQREWRLSGSTIS